MKKIRMEKIIENAQCAKQIIMDFVCLLDDHVMRRIEMTMCYDEAKRVSKGDMVCRTEYDSAKILVAMELVSFVEGVAAHLGVESKSVVENWLIGLARHDLGLHISNNENRIIACQQIELFPSHLSDRVKGHDMLARKAIYVADDVYRAMMNIGHGMEQLREGKGGAQ